MDKVKEAGDIKLASGETLREALGRVLRTPKPKAKKKATRKKKPKS